MTKCADPEVGLEPVTGVVRGLLAVLCAVAVANVYYAQPLLERIGTDLGIPAAGLGAVVAVAQAGYLVGLVLLVPLGDLVDRRTLIVVQVVAVAAGCAVVVGATGSAGLLVGMAVVGLFSVVVQIAVAYVAAVSGPAERGRNVGTVTGGVVVGIILARTVSGAVADLADWRWVYAGSAVLALVLAVAVLVLLPAATEKRKVRGPGSASRYGRAVASVVTLTATDRVFRVRALICLFVFASFGVLWSGMALPLSGEPWNLSTTQIGLFGVVGLAGALGAARAGRWADRGWGEAVTVCSLVGLVVSWLFIGQAGHSLVLFAVGVVVLDFAVQAVHVTSQNRIVAARPESSGRIIGAYMVFYSLGSALGAVTAAWVYAKVGWGAVSVLGAAYAGAALVVWLVDRRLPRAGADSRPRSVGGVG
ncbi:MULTISPECIES: MFS transporter [unclassified Nocardiopsis]|uniref:MFS transporter n=1 Tax=Nocardiopsis TaxID=2013 RepID=UPI00387B861C